MARSINSYKMKPPTDSEKNGGVLRVERGNVMPTVRTTSKQDVPTGSRSAMFGNNKPECTDC